MNQFSLFIFQCALNAHFNIYWLIIILTTILSWGCSSVGRASALQAGGQEFDSPHLHQSIYFMDAILNENAKHFHFLSPLTETNTGVRKYEVVPKNRDKQGKGFMCCAKHSQYKSQGDLECTLKSI